VAPCDGGRAVGGRYRDCNVVELAFNQIKRWRGLATRYDVHVLNYRGGLVLAAILLWLRSRETRPLARGFHRGGFIGAC
jgi:hypothetical protein